MRGYRSSLLFLGFVLAWLAPAGADPSPSPPPSDEELKRRALALEGNSSTNGISPVAPEPVKDPDPVKDIIATKNCTQVEESPDKGWVAVTRDFSRPPRKYIWQDGDKQSCLEIRELDTPTGFGIDFIYWEEATLDILKIAWSPDSRFLVILCSTADGHQPWAHPTFVLDLHDDKLHSMDPFGTIVSSEIKFTSAGELELSTGEPSSPQPFQVDLAKHIGDLPAVLTLHEQH